jgi:hypothetical protein
MISALGILVDGDEQLVRALRKTLQALARHQTARGHIPSLAHDPRERGASDTTPLFLFGLALYREVAGEADFLHGAAENALTWMAYQSPDDHGMIGQLPTTDWRDEQQVVGFGLYVNCISHAYLRLYGCHERADELRNMMNRWDIGGGEAHRHVHEGLAVPHKPYYALWSFKQARSERFDLLGNCLAILTGIASRTRAGQMISWIEGEADALRKRGKLVVQSVPCLIPYILRRDVDWMERYERFNRPGEYHNGGIWPFICGFHVAACVAAGRMQLARHHLVALAELVKLRRDEGLSWGFNEWIKAQSGEARGQDWQTWSAAMFLYAASCVEQGRTPFFDAIRAGTEQ